MRLFTFKGRIGRKAYLILMLFMYLPLYPFYVIGDIASHAIDPSSTIDHGPASLRTVEMNTGLAYAVISLMVVVALLLAFITISFSIRRLHDVDLSGWFVLAFGLTYFIPDIPGREYVPAPGSLVCILVMSVVPGIAGPNRFGAAPSERGSPAVGQVEPSPERS